MSTTNDTNSSAVHDPAAVKENKKKITVRTSDDEVFDLDEKVAMELGPIKTLVLEAPGVSQDTVPLTRVKSWELMKVIKYCTKKLKLQAKLDGDEEMKTFQAEFIEDLSNESLMQLCLVADYLNITYLQGFLVPPLALRVVNMTGEEMRKLFRFERKWDEHQSVHRFDLGAMNN